MSLNLFKYFSKHFVESLSNNSFDRTTMDWYYFMHIPKTAGTTFRFNLYDYFVQNSIYPNYKEIIKKGSYLKWNDFKENSEDVFPKNKILLIGHYGYRPAHFFKPNSPKILTFLRNPVNRVKSSIVFQQKEGRRYYGLSIEYILDNYLELEGSLQSRILGYTPPKRTNWKAVYNRMENIDFIGISEQYDRSIALCNAKFGWTLKSGKSRNIGNYNNSIFSTEQIEKITDACHSDQLVYDHALQLFEQECSIYGI